MYDLGPLIRQSHPKKRVKQFHEIDCDEYLRIVCRIRILAILFKMQIFSL